MAGCRLHQNNARQLSRSIPEMSAGREYYGKSLNNAAKIVYNVVLARLLHRNGL
jgi:hypothetical protein